MPALPRIEHPAIEELARQLRFAPARAIRRHIDRAERLVGEIDPGTSYPVDWVVYRVTGYRQDSGSAAPIAGAEVLSDMSALVERLCEAAGTSEVPDGALSTDELCARWSVSRKTLERYRRRGLVARRVDLGKGRRRLIYAPQSIDAFEHRQAGSIRRAGGFSRISCDDRARIVALAARSQRRFGWSLSTTASHIAPRYGRSREAIRQLLRRHDRDAAATGGRVLFGLAGPPTSGERLLIVRGLRRGIEPGLLGERLGRSSAAVARAHKQGRLDLLRALDLSGPVAPTFDRADAGEVLLAPAPVRSGLGRAGPTDLRELVESWRVHRPALGVEERARSLAYQYLRFRAGRAVPGLGPTPSAASLDGVETDLRWAALLKIELVGSQLPVAAAAVESRLGGPVDSIDPRMLAQLVVALVDVVSSAVDRFDPLHGGRLASPVVLASNRLAAGWLRHALAPATGRAARRLRSGTPIADWTRGVAPWQRWLSLDRRIDVVWRDDRGGLDAAQRLLLARRHGLDGAPPETIGAIAGRLGLDRALATRLERRAVRLALAHARASSAAAGWGGRMAS